MKIFKTIIIFLFVSSSIFGQKNSDYQGPRLRFNGSSDRKIKMSLEELKNAKLQVYIPEFKYDNKFKILKYIIKTGNEKEVFVERSDSITKEVYSKIEKLKIGEEIIISKVNIYYISTSNRISCLRKPLDQTIYIELTKHK